MIRTTKTNVGRKETMNTISKSNKFLLSCLQNSGDEFPLKNYSFLKFLLFQIFSLIFILINTILILNIEKDILETENNFIIDNYENNYSNYPQLNCSYIDLSNNFISFYSFIKNKNSENKSIPGKLSEIINSLALFLNSTYLNKQNYTIDNNKDYIEDYNFYLSKKIYLFLNNSKDFLLDVANQELDISKLKVLCLIIFSYDLLILIIFIFLCMFKRRIYIYIYYLVSFTCCINTFLNFQILRVIFNIKNLLFLIQFTLPIVNCCFIIFWVIIMESNFLINIIAYVFSNLLIYLFSLGTDWGKNYSYIYLIIIIFPYGILSLYVNEEKRYHHTILENIKRDLEKTKNIVKNLNSGILVFKKDMTCDFNKKYTQIVQTDLFRKKEFYEYMNKIMLFTKIDEINSELDKNIIDFFKKYRKIFQDIENDLRNNLTNKNLNKNKPGLKNVNTINKLSSNSDNEVYELEKFKTNYDNIINQKYSNEENSEGINIYDIIEKKLYAIADFEINNFISYLFENIYFDQFHFLGTVKIKNFLSTLTQENIYQIYIRNNFFNENIEFLIYDITSVKKVEDYRAQNKYKKMFLNKFSHEFRNPILNISQLIKNVKSQLSSTIEPFGILKTKSDFSKSIDEIDENLDHVKNICNFMSLLISDFDFVANSNIHSQNEEFLKIFNKENNDNEDQEGRFEENRYNSDNEKPFEENDKIENKDEISKNSHDSKFIYDESKSVIMSKSTNKDYFKKNSKLNYLRIAKTQNFFKNTISKIFRRKTKESEIGKSLIRKTLNLNRNKNTENIKNLNKIELINKSSTRRSFKNIIVNKYHPCVINKNYEYKNNNDEINVEDINENPILKEYIEDINEVDNNKKNLGNQINLRNSNIKLEVVRFDLKKMVKMLVKIFRTKILLADKFVVLNYEIESRVPGKITNDQIKLKQIIFNLLSNSFKFTNNGTILLKLFQESYFLVFLLSDTGIGIKSDHLHLLGQPFFKSESANNSYGIGMGLHIVKSHTELLGGVFEIISDFGFGTTVTIKVPINPYKIKKTSSLSEQSFNEKYNYEIIPPPIYFDNYNQNNEGFIKLKTLKPNLSNKIKEKYQVNTDYLLNSLDQNNKNYNNLNSLNIDTNLYKKFEQNNKKLTEIKDEEYLEVENSKVKGEDEIRYKNEKNLENDLDIIQKISRKKNSVFPSIIGMDKDGTILNTKFGFKHLSNINLRNHFTAQDNMNNQMNYQTHFNTGNYVNIVKRKGYKTLMFPLHRTLLSSSTNKTKSLEISNQFLNFNYMDISYDSDESSMRNNTIHYDSIDNSNRILLSRKSSKLIDKIVYKNKQLKSGNLLLENTQSLKNNSNDQKEIKDTRNLNKMRINSNKNNIFLNDCNANSSRNNLNNKSNNMNKSTSIKNNMAWMNSSQYNSNLNNNASTTNININDGKSLKLPDASLDSNSSFGNEELFNLKSNGEVYRILVVDDERLIRESQINVIKKFFLAKNISFEIEESSDGVECLYKIYKGILIGKKYNVIFTDETMNFLKGSSMAKIIRTLIEDSILYDIKIVLITSYETNVMSQSTKELFENIFSKPLTKSTIETFFFDKSKLENSKYIV